MKMGIIKEIRKNGAVAAVKEEGSEQEHTFFIPGWSYTHVNTPKLKSLTTTQGVGLCIGDLVNFYIDPNLHAKPYDAVACNVDVLKHADKAPNKMGNKKSPVPKKPPMNWKKFLMAGDIEDDIIDDNSEGDPDWVPPDNFEDSDDLDSDISEDEINDLAESLKQELKIEEILPKLQTEASDNIVSA